MDLCLSLKAEHIGQLRQSMKNPRPEPPPQVAGRLSRIFTNVFSVTYYMLPQHLTGSSVAFTERIEKGKFTTNKSGTILLGCY